ncbi:MAG: FkbM family methyltransferase [Chthoniobacterales bacterium]|nr:FkbM family methyltransferase [Chthoniobacterales bacterium]
MAGFKLRGRRWLYPWLTYCLSPLLNRLTRATVRFSGFNVRLGAGDLYTFANLFEDYPLSLLEEALDDVDVVVDLGANVGAFSWLISELASNKGLKIPITAVEPNTANVEFLRAQPFAEALVVHHAAVGPAGGMARLIRGQNSVTDHVDFSGGEEGSQISVLSLESLCNRRALVKMDIEGGELEVLRQKLPDNVLHMVLEWHPDSRKPSQLPSDLIAGVWRRISTDLFGSSMWYFRRGVLAPQRESGNERRALVAAERGTP